MESEQEKKIKKRKRGEKRQMKVNESAFGCFRV